MSEEENTKESPQEVNNESETKNYQPQTESMEVHHHPHVEKKNFKEYFLEFVMIFLAVTMGFIAENIREHFADKSITREVLQSYRTELIQQQDIFRANKKELITKALTCDSAREIIRTEKENEEIVQLSRLFQNLSPLTFTMVNTSAYNQIINTGIMRNIHNTSLLNAIGKYESRIEGFKGYNISINQAILNMETEVSKIQDFYNFIQPDSGLIPNRPTQVFLMKPFKKMTSEQRGLMTWYYELFDVQAYSNLSWTRELLQDNLELTDMLDKELKNY